MNIVKSYEENGYYLAKSVFTNDFCKELLDYLNTLELGNERNQLISLNAHLQRQWDADYFRKMLSIYPQEKSNESSRK